QGPLEDLGERTPDLLSNAEGHRNRLQRRRRLRPGGEVDEPRAVGKRVDERLRRFDREPGVSDAAASDHRDQARAGGGRLNRLHRRDAPHERAQLERKVVQKALPPAKRRGFHGEAVDDELMQSNGMGYAAQRMRSDVAPQRPTRPAGWNPGGALL